MAGRGAAGARKADCGCSAADRCGSGGFRDEFLNGETFYSLREAQILIENWRCHYNTIRPHSSLGFRRLAPESIIPMDQRSIMH